ncbi:MAG: DUF3575 domain-containing protein, partial [Rikenellaceae bacterium]
STLMLHLVGYDDNLKGEELSGYLALNRAAYLVEYIKSYNVRKEQLSYASGGVDSLANDKTKGCRVDIFQLYVDSTSLKVVKPDGGSVESNGVALGGVSKEVDRLPVRGDDSRNGGKKAQSGGSLSIVDADYETISPTKPLLNIRTNLLYWAGGVINFGCEVVMPGGNFSYLINGGYSPLNSTLYECSLGVWFVAPEFRYYLSRNPRWYVGVELLCGEYNCVLTDTGYQGAIYGGGVTAGYRAKLSNSLDLEFSLGVGYGYLNYDTYHQVNGVNVVEQWGVERGVAMPVQAGLNLIWKLGSTLANEKR